jgi:hypothetical protein
VSQAIAALRPLIERASRLSLGECMVGIALVPLYLTPWTFGVLSFGVCLVYPIWWACRECAGHPVGGRRGSLGRSLASRIAALVFVNWTLQVVLSLLGAPGYAPGWPTIYLLIGWYALPVVLSGFLMFSAIVVGLRRHRWRRVVRTLPPPKEEIRWL